MIRSSSVKLKTYRERSLALEPNVADTYAKLHTPSSAFLSGDACSLGGRLSAASSSKEATNQQQVLGHAAADAKTYEFKDAKHSKEEEKRVRLRAPQQDFFAVQC